MKTNRLSKMVVMSLIMAFAAFGPASANNWFEAERIMR
jgi:hypothetical protein